MMKQRELAPVSCILVLILSTTTIVIKSGAVQGGAVKEGGAKQGASVVGFANLPFDLFGGEDDLNNIKKDPKWGSVLPDPGDITICPSSDFYGPQCSSRHHVLDKPSGLKKLICGINGVPKERINGHVNWDAATYDGTISFNDYSDDFDWTWNLKPRDGAGLTKKNPGSVTAQPEYIHAEFDATETVNGFLTNTWKKVREGLECFEDEEGCLGPNGKNETAHKLVDGKRAVVTGLIGLDSEHGGYSELHPVYAMAIEVNADPNDDTWILFIRNRGNEGFCSKHDHPLQGITRFMLLIPKPPNAQVVDARATGTFSSTIKGNCPTWMFDQTNKQGEILTFDLPAAPSVGGPFFGPMVEGEIHISWNGQGELTPFQPEPTPMSAQDQDEHFLKSLNQRRSYFERMSQRIRTLTTSQFYDCALSLNRTHVVTQTKARPTVGNIGRRAVETYLRQYDYARLGELCSADNTISGCKSFNKKRTSRQTRP